MDKADSLPLSLPNVHSKPRMCSLSSGFRLALATLCVVLMVTVKPTDSDLEENPLPFLVTVTIQEPGWGGAGWGRGSGSLLFHVEPFPTYFSNIRLLLPSLLRKRHAFGCVLKNIPYANGMSPSAKEGRAVFKGKTITEMRYSQRGTKEPGRR